MEIHAPVRRAEYGVVTPMSQAMLAVAVSIIPGFRRLHHVGAVGSGQPCSFAMSLAQCSSAGLTEPVEQTSPFGSSAFAMPIRSRWRPVPSRLSFNRELLSMRCTRCATACSINARQPRKQSIALESESSQHIRKPYKNSHSWIDVVKR